MEETSDFFNKGFGWVCRHCDRELSQIFVDDETVPRLLREGEAESKDPEMATAALARWADPERRTLMCPRCGITELVDVH